MENQVKKPFYKNKLLTVPFAILMTAALTLAVGIYISSVHATVTVNEAISQDNAPIVITSAYPNMVSSQDIIINNAAPVNETVTLTWNETSNPDGVSYSTNLPQTVTLASGANTETISFNIASDSINGTVEGDIIVTRI